MGELSPLHLILVLVIALIVVGPGKLPEVGAAIGKSIREFRKATSDVKEAVSLEPTQPAAGSTPPPAPAPVAFAPAPIQSAPAVAPAPAGAPAAVDVPVELPGA
jgi:sec-independent protein translocase protein TatA